MYRPHGVVISDSNVTCRYSLQTLIRRTWFGVNLWQERMLSTMWQSLSRLGWYTNASVVLILASILLSPVQIDCVQLHSRWGTNLLGNERRLNPIPVPSWAQDTIISNSVWHSPGQRRCFTTNCTCWISCWICKGHIAIPPYRCGRNAIFCGNDETKPPLVSVAATARFSIFCSCFW